MIKTHKLLAYSAIDKNTQKPILVLKFFYKSYYQNDEIVAKSIVIGDKQTAQQFLESFVNSFENFEKRLDFHNKISERRNRDNSKWQNQKNPQVKNT